jgi:hypothetical protein
VHKGDDLTTFIEPNVEKIRSLNLLVPQGALQVCSGKTEKKKSTTIIYTLKGSNRISVADLFVTLVGEKVNTTNNSPKMFPPANEEICLEVNKDPDCAVLVFSEV